MCFCFQRYVFALLKRYKYSFYAIRIPCTVRRQLYLSYFIVTYCRAEHFGYGPTFVELHSSIYIIALYNVVFV